MQETDSGRMSGGGIFHLSLWLGLILSLAWLSGCASSSSSGLGSHAGITIKGHEVTDVVLMTRAVFNDHGFTLTRAETDRMIFDRPGTKSEQVKYGTFSSPGVVIRAKVDIQEMGPKDFYLRCDVFTVRDAGQSILEDETRMMMLSSRRYQKMLNQIQSRLDAPTDPAEADS